MNDLKKPGVVRRLANWAKKHKTTLGLTTAAIGVPAAVAIGLQASAEANQDRRDKAMPESSASMPPLFVGGGGGGGGGGYVPPMRCQSMWGPPPRIHTATAELLSNEKEKNQFNV